MNNKSLFDETKIGNDIQLRNRIVMAPMTRSRADENDTECVRGNETICLLR